MMTEKPNLDYIREISGGNEEFEKEFLNVIRMEFPEEKKEYLDNLGKGNFKASAMVVHKIKHKFGVLGLNTAYKLAIDYEEELKCADTKKKDEFDKTLKLVEDFILNIE